MNKLPFVLLTGVLATGVAYAQGEAQPPPADTTGAPASPAPSTSPTEGTAADRTSPQSTPTAAEPSPGEANPTPSTNPAEGTAADRTAPGQTSTTGDTSTYSQDNTRMAAAGSRGQSASQLIGASVQGTSGDTIGTVQDVLIDQSGKVSAVLIQQSGSSSTTGTQPSSIPWDAVRSMDSDGKIIVDSSRVKNVQGSSELR